MRLSPVCLCRNEQRFLVAKVRAGHQLSSCPVWGSTQSCLPMLTEGDPSGREVGRQWRRERQREGEMGGREQWGGDKTAACLHPTFYSSVNPFVWRVSQRLCGIVGGWCLNSASSPSFRTNPGGFIITLVTNHHFPMIVAGVSPRNLLVFCFWAANSLLSEHLCCFYDSLLI